MDAVKKVANALWTCCDGETASVRDISAMYVCMYVHALLMLWLSPLFVYTFLGVYVCMCVCTSRSKDIEPLLGRSNKRVGVCACVCACMCMYVYVSDI
jgi:hypothetical protein